MIALQPSDTSSWLARTRTIGGLRLQARSRSTHHALRLRGIELARAYRGPANQPGFTQHQHNNRARSDGARVLGPGCYCPVEVYGEGPNRPPPHPVTAAGFVTATAVPPSRLRYGSD